MHRLKRDTVDRADPWIPYCRNLLKLTLLEAPMCVTSKNSFGLPYYRGLTTLFDISERAVLSVYG